MSGSRVLLVVAGVLLLAGGCKVVPPSQTWADSDPVGERQNTRLARSGPLMEAQGFAVLDFRVMRDEFSRVHVIGEIRNTGSAARAVELQATLRGEDRRILAVGHFYPTTYTNIQPNETWPFAYSFGRQEGVAHAELRIVGAFRTMETVNVAYEAR